MLAKQVNKFQDLNSRPETCLAPESDGLVNQNLEILIEEARLLAAASK